MFIAVLSVQPDTLPFASGLLLLQMYRPVATARKIVRGNYPLPIPYFYAATDAPKFVPARTGVGAGALAVPWKHADGCMSMIARVLVDFAVRSPGYFSARENEAGK